MTKIYKHMVISLKEIIEYVRNELEDFRKQRSEIEDKLHSNELDIQESRQTVELIKRDNNATGMIFMSTDKNTGFNTEEVIRLEQMISDMEKSQKSMKAEKDNIDKKISKLESILSNKDNTGVETYKYTSHDLINYVEAERQRISADIHDSIIQNLTAMMYKMELIKKVVDSDHNRAKLEIESGNKIIKDCIEELRNIIFNLHPMSLDDLDTEGVFNDFIGKIKQSTDMVVDYSYHSKLKHIDNSVVIMLLRIIQELCCNSIKHSGGTRIQISVDITPDVINIIQSDNGKGYDYSIINNPKTTSDNTGFGLVLLKERLGLIDGKIKISDIESGGVEYKITVPVPHLADV